MSALRTVPVLVRLSDMVNFQIFGLCNLLGQLQKEEAIFQTLAFHAVTGDHVAVVAAHIVPAFHRERMTGMLKFAADLADRLELQAVHDRIEIFNLKLRQDSFSLQECSIQIRTLREAFESGIQYIYFFHYRRDKVALLNKVTSDWSEVLNKFDYLKSDITSAVDCYALDLQVASVFHLMLVMEHGVQAFGKKLRVDLVRSNPGKRVSELTWDQVLNGITPKLKAMPQDTVAKKRRYEKYSAVQAYLYGVKDAWRNPTMHPRHTGYTPLQNFNLINHVRSFMAELAHIL